MNKKIHKDISQYEYISFDIFDTLLIRPYINPYHIFMHIERFFNATGFAELRVEAESKARETAQTEDVSLDDIYSYLSDDYQVLKCLELEFENKLLRPNPEVIKIYKEAKRKNKKIIITSDMYLPKEFLQKVLDKNGIDTYEKFYLSNDIGLAKYTGNLFAYILSDLQVSPSRLLHIGDSILSDVKNPEKLGIHTWYIPKISEQFFNDPYHKRFNELYHLFPNSLEISIVLSLLAEAYQKNALLFKCAKAYWTDLGYCIGGIVGYAFAAFILKQSARDNNKQLLCVARDGYIIKQILDILKTEDIKTFYIYAQRILRARILLDYGDEHNADLLLYVMSEKLGSIPEFGSFQEKEDFIKMHINDFLPLAKQKKKEYLDYLLHSGIDVQKNMMLIDTGAATFSAQKIIESVVNKKILGVYTMIASKRRAAENHIRYSTWGGRLDDISSISGVVEFLFTSPELPIVDFVDNKPIYIKSPMPEEIKRGEACSFIAEGIVNFAKNIKDRFGDLLIPMDAVEINKFVFQFCNNLNSLDKQYLGMIYCSSNASHTEYNTSLLSQIAKYSVPPKARKFYSKILPKIFSIKKKGEKNKKHRQITILGVKISLKI